MMQHSGRPIHFHDELAPSFTYPLLLPVERSHREVMRGVVLAEIVSAPCFHPASRLSLSMSCPSKPYHHPIAIALHTCLLLHHSLCLPLVCPDIAEDFPVASNSPHCATTVPLLSVFKVSGRRATNDGDAWTMWTRIRDETKQIEMICLRPELGDD
jgi:hypothetical protein